MEQLRATGDIGGAKALLRRLATDGEKQAADHWRQLGAIAMLDNVTEGIAAYAKAAEQLRGMFAQAGGQRRKSRKVTVAEARVQLIEEEAGKLINDDTFLKNAKLSLQKLDKATDSLEDQGPLSVLGIALNGLF